MKREKPIDSRNPLVQPRASFQFSSFTFHWDEPPSKASSSINRHACLMMTIQLNWIESHDDNSPSHSVVSPSQLTQFKGSQCKNKRHSLVVGGVRIIRWGSIELRIDSNGNKTKQTRGGAWFCMRANLSSGDYNCRNYSCCWASLRGEYPLLWVARALVWHARSFFTTKTLDKLECQRHFWSPFVSFLYCFHNTKQHPFSCTFHF